jgi:hypothetical protein
MFPPEARVWVFIHNVDVSIYSVLGIYTNAADNDASIEIWALNM